VWGGGDNEGSSVVLGTMGEVEKGGGGNMGQQGGKQEQDRMSGKGNREGDRVRRKVNEGIKKKGRFRDSRT
jgi:hypothetical protein